MSVVFGDLVEYSIGGGWGTDEAEADSSAIGYVIRGTDIPRVALGDVSTVPLRFHKTSNLASRVLKPGDIVFEVSGGSKDQPVGRALQITDEVLAKFDHPVMCASFCKLVRLDQAKAEPGYIFRTLKAAYVDGRLGTFQVQSTGIANFKWKPFLEHFEVDLPERSVQQRVATTLDVFDDCLRNNRRRIEVLEEMARAIYREWFVKFRYPGHGDVSLVDSALGPIPDGWEASTLGSIADITSGQSPKSEFYNEDGIGQPFHQGVADFGAHFPQTRKWCSVDGRSAFDGDILISVRAPVGRINVADTDITIGRGLAAVRAKSGKQALLLGQLREVFAQEDAMGNDGAIFKSLSKTELASIPVLVPPDELTNASNEILSDILAMIRELSHATRQLTDLRDLLLPKLLTGQIDVSKLGLEALVEGAVV